MSDVLIKREASQESQATPPQPGSNSSSTARNTNRNSASSPASSITDSSTTQFPDVNSSQDMPHGTSVANTRGARVQRNYRAVGRGAARANRTRARGGLARGATRAPVESSSSSEEEESSAESASSVEEVVPRPRKKARQTQERDLKPWSVASDVGRRFTNDDLSLLENGTYSDAKIECLKHIWNVHRTILCTRSPWFAEEFRKNMEEGKECHLILNEYEKEDIDTVLHFVYSGSLEPAKFNLEKGTFVMFANIYNIGLTFKLPALQGDALTMLGQFCDAKLAALCSYDAATSGRNGVLSPAGDPAAYGADLLEAIWRAYNEVPESNELQAMLATFVYAGRARLFYLDGFPDLSERCPMFGNDIFKVMLGTTISAYTPGHDAMRRISVALDHTHRSQHPDRCTHCNEVFNDTKNQRGMYNPFELTVRPATYCAVCVSTTETAGIPLWRISTDEERE